MKHVICKKCNHKFYARSVNTCCMKCDSDEIEEVR